jgi:hypothetical protein
MDGASADQSHYTDNAIRAIRNKKQVPEIDFTLHTMEDGSTVSTQERVCKGVSAHLPEPANIDGAALCAIKLTLPRRRCPSSRLQYANR